MACRTCIKATGLGLGFITLLLLTIRIVVQTKPEWLNGVGGCRREALVPYKSIKLPAGKPFCVLITGASSGIGKAMAQGFYDLDNVVLIGTARSKDRALKAIDTSSKTVRNSQVVGLELDQEIVSSIDRFVQELKSTVQSKCNGQLDVAYLNAGALYPNGYNGTTVAEDGKTDKLFMGNFVGHLRITKGLLDLFLASNTRVIQVSSAGHYAGNPEFVLNPLPSKLRHDLDGLSVYESSKLALQMAQMLMREDKRLINTFAATCGMVDTPITRSYDVRADYADNGMPYPFNQDGLMFGPTEVAEGFLISLAVLPLEKVGPREFILPYLYPIAKWEWTRHLPLIVRTVTHLPLIEPFQRLTYTKDHVWVCPVSFWADDVNFLQRMRQKYSL